MTRVEYPEPMARFRCNEQGCCCQDWVVPFQPPDLRLLLAHHTDAEMQEILAGAKFVGGPGGRMRAFSLRQCGEEKACQFLDGDRRCGLQVKKGVETLPNICRAYPAGAVWTDEARQLFWDLCCPEVLERLDESDDSYAIVSREVDEEDHLAVRSQLQFSLPELRLGGRVLSWADFERLRRALIAAFNARERSPLATLAAADWALWRVRRGAPIEEFAVRDDDPHGPWAAYFEHCVWAHDSALIFDQLKGYQRFVFSIDLSGADWRDLPRHLERRDGWRALIDPNAPDLAPLVFRYLAHRAYTPFGVSYLTSQVDLVLGGITHNLATGLRLAAGLTAWLGLEDRRTALKVGLGASEFAYRSFRNAPASSMPWFDPDGA